jgi:Mycotoxin biosynthesis protein UstYa
LDVGEPKYFGNPSEEIDAAWKNLLKGKFPGVSDEEARGLGFQESDRNPATGNFHIAIDVFHSLHCLNAVRKELDKDYYQARGGHHHSVWSDKSQRAHIDHCLNHIRQSLQCGADLSPAAMKKHRFREGESFYLGNADSHTCRDFEGVLQWKETRMKGPYGAWEES